MKITLNDSTQDLLITNFEGRACGDFDRLCEAFDLALEETNVRHTIDLPDDLIGLCREALARATADALAATADLERALTKP